MMTTSISSARTASRLLRARLGQLEPLQQVVLIAHLDTIDTFLVELGKVPEAEPPPPPEPPPRPVAHLEHDVAFAALEVRRKRIQMAGFRAGLSATDRAMSVPYASFDAAVERLAKAIGE